MFGAMRSVEICFFQPKLQLYVCCMMNKLSKVYTRNIQSEDNAKVLNATIIWIN